MDETGHLSRQGLLSAHRPHQFGVASGDGRGVAVDDDLVHDRSQVVPPERRRAVSQPLADDDAESLDLARQDALHGQCLKPAQSGDLD